MRFKFPVYPITDTVLSGLSHAAQTARLAESGAEFIQLREKNSISRDFFDDAAEALKIARGARIKLLVNDRVDIALALGADGVHLGQDDLPPEYARELLGNEALIGYSTHNLEQAEKASGLPIDYIALGPVFQTETKSNPDPVVGPELIAKIKSRIGDIPLVAIGGIDAENIRLVADSGADAAAVIGSIYCGPEGIRERIEIMARQWR